MTRGRAFLAAVDRFASPPRWLSDAADGRAVEEAVRASAAAGELGGEVVAVQPLDIRRDGTGWRAWYALTVRGSAGRTETVQVAGPLTPPRPGPSGRGELGLALRPVAAGADLPALATLTDPPAAVALLERVVGARAWPGFRVLQCEPQVVRHARGARVTVVLRLEHPAGADPRWPSVVVAKAYRDDEGAGTHAAMTALWDSGVAGAGVVALAQPLGYEPELGVLLQGPVPAERTLTELLVGAVQDGSEQALDRLHRALGATAGGLVALHRSGVAGGPARTPDALAGRVRKAVRRLGDAVPEVAGDAEALLGPLQRRAAALPADPPVPSHGGFRPAQVLLDQRDRPGFIDFDGFCQTEPAFDLGRFRARLREIALTAPGGAYPPLSPARRRLADGLADVVSDSYTAQAPVSADRVALWEELELVTALVQSWTRAQLTRTPALAALLRAAPP